MGVEPSTDEGRSSDEGSPWESTQALSSSHHQQPADERGHGRHEGHHKRSLNIFGFQIESNSLKIEHFGQ